MWQVGLWSVVMSGGVGKPLQQREPRLLAGAHAGDLQDHFSTKSLPTPVFHTFMR